jgi:enoyl-CoA hydratase
MTALVSYLLADRIATLTMDDGKANVMGLPMLAALNAALDRALADEAAAVVLMGRPGLFSGGFDLSVFKTDPKALYQMLVTGAMLSERLLSYPIPVVTACTGHAISMGIFLLLSTDVRIGVDQGAKLHINEVQNGMTLPYFAIEVCRQRLLPAHLTLAVATAQPYNPQQALVAGFLDELVPADQLAAAAHSRALELASLNLPAYVATKARLREPTLAAMAVAIERDIAHWQPLLATPA